VKVIIQEARSAVAERSRDACR